MEFQRARRTDPERIFIVVKNTYSTATLTPNQWVAWDSATDKDGVGVIRPSANMRNNIAGVMVETVPVGEYGLMQVYGYRSGARMSGGLAASKVSEGTYLYIKTAGFAAHGLHTIASNVTIPTWRLTNIGFAFSPTNTAAKATSATTWIGNVFVRTL